MAPTDVLTPTGAVCPKCSFQCEFAAAECPRCQVVFDKVLQAEHKLDETLEESRKVDEELSGDPLAAVDLLLVRQHVDKLEAFTGFEQANNYEVMDSAGNVLFVASESSNMWARQFLKGMRPFTMHVSTPRGESVLTMERPWRFYFAEIEVRDAQGKSLGCIKKRWSLVNRRYTLSCPAVGQELEIDGPFWKPWTFQIKRDGTEQGMIRKKWSGGLREIFTDADNFGIEFPREMDVRLKSVFLGAMFLIDYMHFENNND